MKKGVMIFGLILLMTSVASALMCNMQNIIVTGYVYDESGFIKQDGIIGATVYATCLHNGVAITKTAISKSEGKYSITFDKRECNYGDSIIKVYSEAYGTPGPETTGYVQFIYPYACVAKINSPNPNVIPPLIPEFSLAIGVLTVVSAIGVFFIVRRN